MSRAELSVTVEPRHTLESAAVERLCRTAGIRCDQDDDVDDDLFILALPRGSTHTVEELGRYSGHRRVLVIADTEDPLALACARLLHADATVSWRLSSANMLAAIRSAAAGTTVSLRRGSTPARARNRNTLSRRETEVMEQVARGLCDDDIAVRLDISPNTVRTHVQRVIGKLQVADRHAAAAVVRSSLTLRPGNELVPKQRLWGDAG